MKKLVEADDWPGILRHFDLMRPTKIVSYEATCLVFWLFN